MKFLNNLDINQNQLLQALAQVLGSDPGAPVAGQFWYHSGTGTWRFRNASSTVIIGTLDQISAAAADVSLNSHKITNLTDGSNPGDAVNKAQLDAARQGIADVIHDPVLVAVSSNVNVSSPGAALDGVTMSGAPSNRVLLYGQTTTTENGIYDWNGAASAMTRSSDANATGEVIDGSLVAVMQGTHAGWLMIQTGTPSGAPGAWTQVWIQYSTGSAYSADGTTIQLTGSTFALVVPVAVASGGTGATDAATARTNLGATGKFSATIGNGSSTSIAVTHNLGTKDVTVSLRDVGTDVVVETDWTATSINVVTFTFSTAPATSSLRATIHA